MASRTSSDVNREIDRLAGLNAWELRVEWRRQIRTSPPMRLSRDLLMRGIAYRLQERTLGGLSKPVLRRLGEIAADNEQAAQQPTHPPTRLKPGTRLLREWNGETHVVVVQADGIEWQGRNYSSLSKIAGEITGAHWSGPRFFGLRQARPKKSIEEVEPSHESS